MKKKLTNVKYFLSYCRNFNKIKELEMFKKIALATALIASASFATWDKFPVLEAGKGQAKVGVSYMMHGDWSGLDFYAGARYTVVQNLELGLLLPYRIMSDYDGNDGADGLRNLPIMVRYQFMQPMNAFVDLTLPIGEEEIDGDGIGLHAGVQYSMPVNQMVSLGSELGLALETEGDDKWSGPWTLNLGVEADFAVNQMITPYVGVDVNMWLGETTFDGEDTEKVTKFDYNGEESGTIGFWPYVGVSVAFTPMVALDASFGFGIGEDMYGKDTPMTIDVHANINF